MSEHIEPGDAPDSGGPRHVRLQVELVVEITDGDGLTAAALDQIADDAYLPDDERGHARAAVRQDEAEALAYLVDPFDLVNGIPGVELVQASWNSAHIDYDPDDEEWDFADLTDADAADESEGEDEGEDEGGNGGRADR
jgi:hypothetical protein